MGSRVTMGGLVGGRHGADEAKEGRCAVRSRVP